MTITLNSQQTTQAQQKYMMRRIAEQADLFIGMLDSMKMDIGINLHIEMSKAERAHRKRTSAYIEKGYKQTVSNTAKFILVYHLYESLTCDSQQYTLKDLGTIRHDVLLCHSYVLNYREQLNKVIDNELFDDYVSYREAQTMNGSNWDYCVLCAKQS